MNELGVSQEFIKENKKLCQTMPKRGGGRYSLAERKMRKNQVFKLHFELGHSARKIAEMMNVSRHTINNDIRFLYREMSKEWENVDIKGWVIKQITRMDLQRTRIIHDLENVKSFSDKMAIEKLILDIDTRISSFIPKIIASEDAVKDEIVNRLNEHAKKYGYKGRWVSKYDVLKVSEKNKEKIDNILIEDEYSRIKKS